MQAGQLSTIANLHVIGAVPVMADAAGNPVFNLEGSMFVVAARSGEFDGRPMVAGHRYELEKSESAMGLDRNGNIVFVNPANAQWTSWRTVLRRSTDSR